MVVDEKRGGSITTAPPSAGGSVGGSVGGPSCTTTPGRSLLPNPLNSLVPGGNPSRFLYQATDVNDRGQIVVDGQFGCCGYLLDPQ